jgi:WD40 repeat protein
MYSHQGPALSVCWNKARFSSISYDVVFLTSFQEGNKVLSGGADNAARMFDVTTGQSQQVAQHDAPVKVVKWIEAPQGGILATGSWDKTIKVSHSMSISGSINRLVLGCSIGTCAHPLRFRLFNFQNVAIPWMCSIH